MKKLCLFFLMFGMSALMAAPWKIRIDSALTVDDARRVSLGEVATAGWQQIAIPGYRIDLDKAAGKTMPEKSAAVLSYEIEAEENTVWLAGAACDWWLEVYVNGEKLLSTMGVGNEKSQYLPIEHLFNMPLKKGRNIVAVYALRGSKSWNFAFAQIVDKKLLPRDQDELRELLAQTQAKGTPEKLVAIAPWVTKVSKDSATVGIEFHNPMPGAIRYAAAGEEPTVVWTHLNGLKRKQTVHRFDLTALKPGTEYTYTILSLDEKKPADIEVAKGSFRTMPATGVNHVFYAVSDNQVAKKTRIANFNAMFKNCAMGSADFLLSIGDLDSDFSNFRSVYFSSFFDVLVANGFARQAQVVRGNHEWRGTETDMYYDCFGLGYYAFSYGDVFYIVLDTMEDKKVLLQPKHYTLRHILAPYIVDQNAWLEKVIASDACKNAKKRIVIAHTVPFPFENGYYYKNTNAVCGKFFFGPNPLCKIDLWIAGDIHSPYRFDPVTRKFYGAKRNFAQWLRKAFNNMDRSQFTFPVYVNDGPGGAGVNITVTKVAVSEDAIRLTQMTPEGKIQDDVTFQPGKEAIVHSTVFVDYDEKKE